MTAAADLAKLLAAAKPGDTLKLPDGDYGDLALAKPINLIGGKGALFNSVWFKAGSSGSTLLGVSVLRKAQVADNAATNAISIVGIAAAPLHDIILTNVTMQMGLAPDGANGASAHPGQMIGRGITIQNANDIVLTGCDISSAIHGVVVGASKGVTITKSKVHNVRATPIDASGADFLTISYNQIGESHPYGTDHADMIHVFTYTGQPTPTAHLTIIGNTFDQGSGAAVLGINTEDQYGAGFTDINISSNTLRLNNNQGLILSGVRSGVVHANSLQPTIGLDDPKHAPTIVLRPTTVPTPALKISDNYCKMQPALAPFGPNTFWTAAEIASMAAGHHAPGT